MQSFQFFNVGTNKVSRFSEIDKDFHQLPQPHMLQAFYKVLVLEKWDTEDVVLVGDDGLVLWMCEGRIFSADESSFRCQDWVSKIWG